jgi:hypothetical protein
MKKESKSFTKTKIEKKSKFLIKKVVEFKCKCKECGHVWHYLESEEKRAKSGTCWSAYGQMTCCLPMQLYSKQEGLKWEKELDKFKKCPKCGSVNMIKRKIEHVVK